MIHIKPGSEPVFGNILTEINFGVRAQAGANSGSEHKLASACPPSCGSLAGRAAQWRIQQRYLQTFDSRSALTPNLKKLVL